MSTLIKRLKIFLASPGNLMSDREIVRKVVDNINRDVGFREGFQAEVIGWDTDSRPSAGEYAQEVISDQLIADIDIFIGLMGHYFGQPTKKYGSGTEEEFELAFQSWTKSGNPKIMFYFSEAVETVRDVQIDQLAKRNAFRKTLEDRGVYYFSYNDITAFQFDLHRHISQTIREVLESEIDLEIDVSDESSNSLMNFQSLMNTNIEIMAIELINKANSELVSYSKIQEDLNSDIERVAKNTGTFVKKLSVQANKGANGQFERDFERFLKSLENYETQLIEKIPNLATSFDNSMTAFLRAVSIMDSSETGSDAFISEISDSIEGAIDGLQSYRDSLIEAEESFDDWPADVERLHVSKLKIISLHKDLVRHLDNAIATLKRLIGQ